MKKLFTAIVLIHLLMFAFAVHVAGAAESTLAWDAVDGADGYKIQQSLDMGATWDAGLDVGNVTTHTMIDLPETGYVLFRAVSYNAHGQTIRTTAGAWFCGDCKAPDETGGLGVE